MPAGGALHRGFDSETLDGLDPEANRGARIGPRLFQAALHRQIDRGKFVAVGHLDDIPAQRAHRRERRLHAERVFCDAPDRLVSLSEMTRRKGLTRPLAARPGMAAKASLAALHRSAVGNGADRDTVILEQMIRDGQALRLGKRRAERPVAQEHPFRVQMRFAVAGQFALETAESLQILERHAVKSIIGTQGINAVLRVAGIVHEIKGQMPGAVLDGKHEAVNGGHDLGKGRRAAPMTSRAAVDGMDIHQRDQGAGGARIAQHHLRAGGVSTRTA